MHALNCDDRQCFLVGIRVELSVVALLPALLPKCFISETETESMDVVYVCCMLLSLL